MEFKNCFPKVWNELVYLFSRFGPEIFQKEVQRQPGSLPLRLRVFAVKKLHRLGPGQLDNNLLTERVRTSTLQGEIL